MTSCLQFHLDLYKTAVPFQSPNIEMLNKILTNLYHFEYNTDVFDCKR